MRFNFRTMNGQLDMVTRILIVIAVADVLCIAAVAFATSSSVVNASEVKAELSSIRSKLNHVPQATELPSELPQKTIRPGLAPGEDPVSTLQVDIVNLSAQRGVSLGEFQCSQDLAPFVSVFGKQANPSDWNQLKVKVSLSGELRAVIDTISNLRRSRAIFEPDGLKLDRSPTIKSSSKILAEFSARVLIPKEIKG